MNLQQSNLVEKSHAVKKEKGILGRCAKKQGDVLSNELKEEISNFTKSDKKSRICQGMRVSIRNKDGEKVKHQNHQVLSCYMERAQPRQESWILPHLQLYIQKIVF